MGVQKHEGGRSKEGQLPAANAPAVRAVPSRSASLSAGAPPAAANDDWLPSSAIHGLDECLFFSTGLSTTI